MDHARTESEFLAGLVKALLPFLDGPEINVIYDSACVLSRLIKAPELEKRVPEITNSVQDVKSSASLTPAARKLIEDIRATAQQWLEGK